MGFTLEELAGVLRVLVDRSVRFVVIGDTVVQLALKKRVLEGDVDLFIIEPSVFVDEELYRNIAVENRWEYGYTEAGTPRYIARIGDKEVVLELYENFMDIDIPESILESAKTIKISDLRIRVLNPEQYFVLKARQGVDLDKLARYLKELKKIDHRLLKDAIEQYPREEQELIIERLRSIGLDI
jgi:predicted nucleotidyltransferase